jgi:PadR family transcriptional regulator PadR
MEPYFELRRMQRLTKSLATEPKVEARPRKWLFPVVLVVLQEESSYGYEIMERLAREFGFEQVSPGTIYRTLRQMEKEGLCDSEWETSAEDGLARRMYYITDYGEAYLDAWVEACKEYGWVMSNFSRVYTNSRPRTS